MGWWIPHSAWPVCSYRGFARRWVHVNDRRARLGVGVGVLGLGLGVAAAVWDAVLLALLAGSAALVAGVAATRLVGHLRTADERIAELADEVGRLESSERHTAELLAARIDRTAIRTGPEQPDHLTDPASGLFSEAYFDVAIESRIASARRRLRPIAVALIDVIDGLGTANAQPADPVWVGALLLETVREADTVCRMTDGGYAVIMEDTPENGAIFCIERLRKAMVEREPHLTLWAGVACYPAHGLTDVEVVGQARRALRSAREWRQHRIEVASTSD